MAASFIIALAAVMMAISLVATAAAAAAPASPGETFTTYPDEARASVLADRLLTPLTALDLAAGLTRTGRTVRQEQVAIAAERFLVIVPSVKPPGGYGLLTFIPPWPDLRIPQGWAKILDRLGIIFVTAQNSGNTTSMLGRREPLALIAALNLQRRFAIDRSRMFIGGFSGGSRVALRLAVAYPDVFTGALLDAGSDPIGTFDVPLPAEPLLGMVQRQSRFVLVSGDQDAENREKDNDAALSLAQNCIAHVAKFTASQTGHEAMAAADLASALRLIDRSWPPDAAIACRANLAQRLAASLAAFDAAVASGNVRSAKQTLLAIDRRFGGLARPPLSSRMAVVRSVLAKE